MKSILLRVAVFAAITLTFATLSLAEDRDTETKRVDNAANVLTDIMRTPDKGIPDGIMKSAVCVGVIPSMKKGGFIFGAEYGKGVASCHNANGWSAPAPVTIGGGTWGLQIGGEAVDVVFLVMNNKGMEDLLSSKFTLGANASVAAGPVGRQAEGDTDWKLKAEVLTYSRTRGIFAGLTLNGAVIAQDHDATTAFYGNDVSFRNILMGRVKAPTGSAPFLTALRQFSEQAQTAKVNQSHSQPVQH